ncbi:hypothetical protein [Staphylococcus epidermidis]|uniref:hypothetical protein n=1 Tax=Staphylococcus epidermidis TaxID=1282 RepID=UPI001642AC2F|nr:hypothetical protein [Staphylococcus epidermidis]
MRDGGFGLFLVIIGDMVWLVKELIYWDVGCFGRRKYFVVSIDVDGVDVDMDFC